MTATTEHPATTPGGSRARFAWRSAALVACASFLAVLVPVAASSAGPRSPRVDPPIIPLIALTVGPPMIAPGTASATATITGTSTLTGSLVLHLYAPPDQTCNTTPVASISATIVNGTGTGTVTQSRRIRATDPSGMWHWKATYNGVGTHASASSLCKDQLILQLDPSPWPAFTSATDLVTEQYRDFLGRLPTAGELATWVGRLTDRTAGPGDVVEALRQDPDQLTNVDPAVRLYRAYFLRSPEASGLRYWISERRKGRTLGSISEFFANSSEFKNRYGALTNAQFVGLVYENILEREGEPGGVAYWTDQLNRRLRNRGTVMIGFSESPEYVRAQSSEVTVSVLYALMLGRAPTAAEFEATVDLLDVGATSSFPFRTAELAEDLLARGEYASRS